jgi:hypothetical protein
MGSNPYKYTATLDTPIPAVISLPEINWSGNLVSLMNGIPSSAYNDVVYPIEKAAFAANGADLESVTNSHWINDNGKLAFTFDMVIDPLSAWESASIIAGTVGVLVAAVVSLATSWSTWIALVIGAVAAVIAWEFVTTYVVNNGPEFPGGNNNNNNNKNNTNGGGSPAGSSCSSTSQCAQGLVCQNGTCTQCNGIIVGSTCVPTWALIAGVGVVALTGVAIAMAKK